MSGISKTIEQVKEEIEFACKSEPIPLYCEHLIEDIIGIIAELKNERELRQSQKQLLVFRIRECEALEKMIDNLKGWPKQRSDLKAELSTANKRISELEIKFEKQQMYIGLLEQSFSEKVDNETFVSEKEYCVGIVQARFRKGADR